MLAARFRRRKADLLRQQLIAAAARLPFLQLLLLVNFLD